MKSSKSLAKADLHVHSKYSDQPSTWGHKAYNSPESFTEVDTLYLQAKKRGMDFVTITDHDDIRGCLELRQLSPLDTFISVELTTYFPEDECKLHLLIYGISEPQFDDLVDLSRNVYQVREYLLKYNIAHSVAHATYDQDGKLSFEHIEKMVLLFNNFEVLNGACDTQNNVILHQFLDKLSPQSIARFSEKHAIEPHGIRAWHKGYTGGSDDHCGILIGSAYTQCAATTVDDYLDRLRNNACEANGMHGSFAAYATGVIKHIHDYRSHRDGNYSSSKMFDFLELFFSDTQGNVIKRFKKSQSLRYLKKQSSKTHKALHKLLKQVRDEKGNDMMLKIPDTYQRIIDLHDEMFISVVVAATKHLPQGDIFKGTSRLATLLPMTILALPFIGSMRHQVLKAKLKKPLIEHSQERYQAKALWVTDTIDDLNGVSVTLRQLATQSLVHGYEMKLVCSVDEDKLQSPLPENCLNIPPVKSVPVPGYETQQICFPSLLRLMQQLHAEKADQIVISTPGPLGLGAMLCAKLLDLPVKSVYHTDFAEQVMRMTEEASLANIVDFAVNIFYKQADQVFAPSAFYVEKLIASGLDKQRVSVFPRGLDIDLYKPGGQPNPTGAQQLAGNFTLLFAGRISEDKNLSLLKRLMAVAPSEINLVIAGDGPELDSLKAHFADRANTLLTGRLAATELVKWYQYSDLLVFPSQTDTFGMVVLEAQACGLPCVVSHIGGPSEIILHGESGEVVATDAEQDWLAAVIRFCQLKHRSPDAWQALRQKCVEHVANNNNWQAVFKTVLGPEYKRQTQAAVSPDEEPSNFQSNEPLIAA